MSERMRERKKPAAAAISRFISASTRPSEKEGLRCQYLYFCTRKASKLSTREHLRPKHLRDVSLFVTLYQ
jgi:hypothetical protein